MVTREPSTPSTDRDVLRQLFFGSLPGTKLNDFDIRRRKTIALILFSSHFAARHGIKLSDQEFLNACYFGQMWDGSRARKVILPVALHDIAAMWKVFRAHDYLAYSCEALLSCFLDFLGKKSHLGGTLEDFLITTKSSRLVNTLSNLTGAPIRRKEGQDVPLAEVMHAVINSLNLGESSGVDVETSLRFDEMVKLSSRSSEFHIMNMLEQAAREDRFNPEEVYASACALLVSVFIRFYSQHATASKTWRWILKHTYGDISPVRFVNDLIAKLKVPSFSIRDFLEWLMRQYVVEQATRVYIEKSTSIYSKPRSWFHREGIYFKRDREYSADHRNTRFLSAVTILEDLGLVNKGESVIKLSEDGERFLSKLVSR